MLPKTEKISASAASGDLYDNGGISKTVLDGLATNAGYSDYFDMRNDIIGGKSIKASDFGTSSILFGGKDWYPVYATSSGGKVVLTLWLKNSVGAYTWADGTWGVNSAYASNNYKYSWIRSAINMGQTSDNGDYYGSWPNSTTSTAAPTKYANNVKSSSASCAPMDFTVFSSILGDQNILKYVEKGGDYGDYLWLPSTSEVASGGIWGCTSTQWAVGVNSWTRTPLASHYYAVYYVNTSGGYVYTGVNDTLAVRPAINVDISSVSVDAPEDVSVVYNKNPQSIADVDAADKKWYDSTLMTLTQLTMPMTNVGTYTVKAELLSSAVLSGVTKFNGTPDTSKGESDTVRYFTFEITPELIPVPSIKSSPTPYTSGVCKFGLIDFDSKIMSVVASKSTSNVTGANITWNSTDEQFEATEAATYTVFFHMDSTNYMWDVGNGTTADQSKTITIDKREITFSTTPLVNLSWGLNANATLTIVPTVKDVANPDYQLEIYYIKDGDTTKHIIAGVDLTTNTLDISQVAATGNYTLCVALTSYAGNKNYCIANNVKEIPFTIGSGAIDYSVIDWYYQEDGNTSLNALFDANGVQDVIRYKMDSTNGNVINYYITANIQNTGGYLSVANDYNTAPYSGGIYTYMGSQSYNGGASAVGTYTTRVVLRTDADHAFPASNRLDNDGLVGWYEITWDISKGQIDQNYLNNIVKYLNYNVGVSGPTESYDKNPPEYSGSTVYISLDSLSYRYLGITGATISGANSGKDPKSYTAMMTFTVDPNYDNPGTINFNWDIAKQSININWTTDTWKAANGDEYQIRVLNIASNLKQYVQYEYYLADPSDYSMQTKLIGVDGTGLQALIDNYGASLSNALPIYVKAVVPSTSNYRLVDNTGNLYDCAVQYNLGSNNTQANVYLSVTVGEYGSTTLNAGILSIIDTDDGSELKNNSKFIDRIYITDAAGNEYDWNSFDFAKAAKGVYTVKIKLTPDGDNEYVLIWPDGHTFEIKPKAIPVPTLSEIVFKNDFINLADCLGGSYLEYKNIITLGGTYDGVKNVSSSYKATLTLTDSNYCWDYSGLTTVKWLVGYSLTDNEFKEISDTVCELSWGITPYVLKTSSWNLSGKEGAAYNLPANLIDGLEVTINYQYYTDKVSNPLAEGESLVAGSTYFVKAELLGADANNFVFEDSKTTTSDFVTYKVPKSGMAAFMGTMKDFFTKTVLGLPVWLWFVIALAVLLFLIIIIAVAKKRSKNKEERLAKKEAKEEEKRRREEERQMQREKLEAERELAKAKQEAELEKIRAQAGLGMAGMGAASMAMAQQPVQSAMGAQQQPQPQPAPQPVYVNGGSDNSQLIAELRAQIAEMRAENKAAQAEMRAENRAAQAQMQMQLQQQYGAPNGNRGGSDATAQPIMSMMPQPQLPTYGQGSGEMAYVLAKIEAELAQIRTNQIAPQVNYAPMPAAMGNDYHSMLAEERAKAAEAKLSEERVRAEAKIAEERVRTEERARAAEQRAMLAEERFLHGGAQSVQNSAATGVNAIPADIVVSLLQAVKGENAAPAPAQEKPAVPPDAVITTTTTVDRSKNNSTNFDVDGFYDDYK